MGEPAKMINCLMSTMISEVYDALKEASGFGVTLGLRNKVLVDGKCQFSFYLPRPPFRTRLP